MNGYLPKEFCFNEINLDNKIIKANPTASMLMHSGPLGSNISDLIRKKVESDDQLVKNVFIG